MVKEKISASKKTFEQKFQSFYKLAKANPGKSYNDLEKIAKERGYSFRRQQMQEAFRLFKSEKTYEKAKNKHSRVKAEIVKKEHKKDISVKRPKVKTQKFENGIKYTRTMLPVRRVEEPQQLEEAIPAATKSVEDAIKYSLMKKKQIKRKKKEYEQVQFALYGWVDIYRYDSDAYDSEEIEGDGESGGQKIFSGLVNSNAFLDFFFPDPEIMAGKIIESWIKNFMKIIQSLNGYFKIRYFQSFVSLWEDVGGK